MPNSHPFDIITAVQNTSSTNDKVEILSHHRHNQQFLRVVKMAYSPFMLFFVKTLPEFQPSGVATKNLTDALNFLENEIATRNITGNAAKDSISAMLSALDEKDRKVIEMVILKDLRMGANVKLLNKALGPVIPTYNTMLASEYDRKALLSIYEYIVQVKIDGARVMAHISSDNTITFRSRNGSFVQQQPPHVVKELLSIAPNLREEMGSEDVVIDGEFVFVEDSKVLDRKIGNGRFNKMLKGTASDEELASARYVIWDCIEESGFQRGTSLFTTIERLGRLIKSLPDNLNSVQMVKTFSNIRSEAVIYAAFEECLKAGEEGIIVKDANFTWVNKRSKRWIKLKAIREADLKIVGFEEGKAGKKFAGMLGAFLCESEDGKVKVKVGSGIDEETRPKYKEMFKVGDIITVEFNELSSNSRGEYSLTHPRFIELRDDKSEADDFDKIKKAAAKIPTVK